MSNRIATMRLSYELLREVLHLPEDTKFLRARETDRWNGAGGEIEFLIEQAGLPECEPNQSAPVACPQLRKSYGPRIETVSFDGWSIY